MSKNNNWVYTIPIAHRGLHDNLFPENTKPAFENAISNGYAIETDIQMTVDGVLVCYHDDSLLRGANIDKDIRKLTLQEVKAIKVFNSDNGILTLDEFLDLVDGKVPIMFELKTQITSGLEEKFVNRLNSYKGDFAVKSFNPLMIKKITKLAPSYYVGVISTQENLKGVNNIILYMMHHFWFTKYVKCNFLSVRNEDLEKVHKKIKKYNVITWTVNSEEKLKIAEKFAKNIVFEYPLRNLGKFENK